MTLAFLLTSLSVIPSVEGAGEVTVGNVSPVIVSDGFYGSDDVTNKHDTMIDPAVGGLQESYRVKATIRDDNTLDDIATVTVYVYDDNAVTGHGFTKGTYDQMGSYGFSWDTGTWKELTSSGWSSTLTQLESASCSSPTLTNNQGEWVFQFKMNKVSRRTTTTAGWKIEVQVLDDNSASALRQDLQFGVNFYHEESMVTTVVWSSASPGDSDLAANGNPYTYTVTANAPFKIQIRSLDTELTGQTFGQTPIPVGNVAIDKDADPSGAVIGVLSTSWQDFDTNTQGYDRTNGSYWFIDIPSVVRDDTYTFDFQSQVLINE